jgi:hypothetical protein
MNATRRLLGFVKHVANEIRLTRSTYRTYRRLGISPEKAIALLFLSLTLLLVPGCFHDRVTAPCTTLPVTTFPTPDSPAPDTIGVTILLCL